jgi:hypothetical protein
MAKGEDRDMARRLLFVTLALASGVALAALPSLAQAADDDAGDYSGAAPDDSYATPDAQAAPEPSHDAVPAPAPDDDSAGAQTPDDDQGEPPAPSEQPD